MCRLVYTLCDKGDMSLPFQLLHLDVSTLYLLWFNGLVWVSSRGQDVATSENFCEKQLREQFAAYLKSHPVRLINGRFSVLTRCLAKCLI